jgi:hypothetical protein
MTNLISPGVVENALADIAAYSHSYNKAARAASTHQEMFASADSRLREYRGRGDSTAQLGDLEQAREEHRVRRDDAFCDAEAVRLSLIECFQYYLTRLTREDA